MGCWEKKLGQDWSVVVGFLFIGVLFLGDEVCGIGEDEIVDVGVFDGGVCVLLEVIKEKYQMKYCGGQVKGEWVVEKGCY